MPDNSTIEQVVEKDIEVTSPGIASTRYPVTQEQIDDILNNELKELKFPVEPTYNPRIKDNGRTVAEVYPWGEFKRIKTIEIGKQDSMDRKFLTDTLLHEYYEAEILLKQNSDDFYKKINIASDEERHKWIHSMITKFFKKLEG